MIGPSAVGGRGGQEEQEAFTASGPEPRHPSG